jgi:D-alanyl-D-alanine carboxypeptidase (penicillin-binding protein 5/6)
MKSYLAFLSLFVLPLLPCGAQTAAAWLIADNATGAVLGSEAADAKRQVASLTKIATATVVFDWSDLSKTDLTQRAIVPPHAVLQGAVNPMGLQPGDEVSLRDLLYASLLQSDNVAAYTLAHFVGARLMPTAPRKLQDLGPVAVFVSQMNALARQLGMKRTLFLNPHGLDGAEFGMPYSTAADIARLARNAMSRPAFRFIVSQPSRKVSILRAGQNVEFELQNTNKLLGQADIDGVKTGRTTRAGDCLVISAARSPESRQQGDQVFITPRRLTVVVLGATDRFPAAAGLLARGWQLFDGWAAAGRPVDPKTAL